LNGWPRSTSSVQYAISAAVCTIGPQPVGHANRHMGGIYAHRSAEKSREWLTMREVAKALGVTNHVIPHLITTGALPAVQVLSRAPYQIRADDLALPRSKRRSPERVGRVALTKRTHSQCFQTLKEGVHNDSAIVAARGATMLNIRRIRCDQHGRLSVARPLAQHGPDVAMGHIMRAQIGACPNRDTPRRADPGVYAYPAGPDTKSFGMTRCELIAGLPRHRVGWQVDVKEALA